MKLMYNTSDGLGSMRFRSKIAKISKNIFESYLKEEAMGVRDIWRCYEGRKRVVSGGIGESECAQAEMALGTWKVSGCIWLQQLGVVWNIIRKVKFSIDCRES